jgi:ACS family hexuronate transporter-like MFS transporter
VTGSAGVLLLLGWKFGDKTVLPLSEPAKESVPAEPIPTDFFPALKKTNNPLSPLLKSRTLWILLIARSLGDAVWFFYIFWLPQYLVQDRGFTLFELGFLGWIPFFMADLGAWSGGWISSRLIMRGWPVLKSRKTVLLGSAALLPMGIVAALTGSHWSALALTGVALWGIMSYGTVVMTLPADLFPAQRIGLVVGLCGTAGSLAGAGFQGATGWLLDHHGYFPVFLIAGLLHPMAALLLTIFLKPSRE